MRRFHVFWGINAESRSRPIFPMILSKTVLITSTLKTWEEENDIRNTRHEFMQEYRRVPPRRTPGRPGPDRFAVGLGRPSVGYGRGLCEGHPDHRRPRIRPRCGEPYRIRRRPYLRRGFVGPRDPLLRRIRFRGIRCRVHMERSVPKLLGAPIGSHTGRHRLHRRICVLRLRFHPFRPPARQHRIRRTARILLLYVPRSIHRRRGQHGIQFGRRGPLRQGRHEAHPVPQRQKRCLHGPGRRRIHRKIRVRGLHDVQVGSHTGRCHLHRRFRIRQLRPRNRLPPEKHHNHQSVGVLRVPFP